MRLKAEVFIKLWFFSIKMVKYNEIWEGIIMINFGKDKTISILTKSMDASALKQRVTSNNIANINTPGYKREYVDFESRLSEAINKDRDLKGKLYRTDEKHFPLNVNIDKIQPMVKTDESTSLREDGNNVDLDMELADLAENTIRYNTLTETAIKKYSGIKNAIRGGR